MKFRLFMSVLAIAVASLLESCYEHEETIESTYCRKCRTNVIGITGASAELPYIVVKHCIANNKETNAKQIDTIIPPYIIEPHYVNVYIDSVSNNYGDNSYTLKIHHDYTEKGAEYLEIENLSDDKTIEFFVAGAQDLYEKELYKSSPYIGCNIPLVTYKYSPIYYLLFPEKKYDKDLSINEGDHDKIYFNGNCSGDLILDKAWTVNEVMDLYRAEFNGSKDIQLYYSTYESNEKKRLTDYIAYRLDGETQKLRLYGTVGPKSVAKTEEGIPVLAIDNFFDPDNICFNRIKK